MSYGPSTSAVKNVGGGLLPIAECQSMHLVTDLPLSGASPLPHLLCVCLANVFQVCGGNI